MPPPPTALVSPVDPALLEIVEAQAGGDWTIVPLAQVECGARTIAVVWPAMDRSGAVVDDDVVGYAFERVGGAPALVDGNFAVRSPSLAQCLGAPTTVRRGRSGLPRDLIADALVSRVRAVQQASASRDRAHFREAVMALAELFDDAALFEAFTDALGELIGDGITIATATTTAAGITVRMHQRGRPDEATLPLVHAPGPSDFVVIDLSRD